MEDIIYKLLAMLQNAQRMNEETLALLETSQRQTETLLDIAERATNLLEHLQARREMGL